MMLVKEDLNPVDRSMMRRPRKLSLKKDEKNFEKLMDQVSARILKANGSLLDKKLRVIEKK